MTMQQSGKTPGFTSLFTRWNFLDNIPNSWSNSPCTALSVLIYSRAKCVQNATKAECQ